VRRGFRSDPLTKAKEEIEALEVTRAFAMAERQAVDNPELEWAESRVVAVRKPVHRQRQRGGVLRKGVRRLTSSLPFSTARISSASAVASSASTGFASASRTVAFGSISPPYLRGSEAVMQARLVSKSPAVLTIRTSVETRAITSEWRAVIDARIFDLKEDPRPSEDGACLEILAEA